MATIRKRKKKDGSFSYIAQVRMARGGHRHAESRAFPRRAMAEEWAKRRELEDASLEPWPEPTLTDLEVLRHMARCLGANRICTGR